MRKIRRVFMGLLLLGATAFAFPELAASAIVATEDGWSPVKIEPQYVLGETLTIPSRTFEGKETEFSITFPNGHSTSDSEIVLDQAGKYEIHYFAKGNNSYTATKDESFVCASTLFSYSNPGSSAYYTELDRLEAPEVAESSLKDSVAPGWNTNKGIYVKLARNDVFKLNYKIDVTKLSSQDILSRFFVVPDARGSADFDNLYMDIVDASNPNIYITTVVHRWLNDAGYSCSFLATGGQNQRLTGLRNGTPISNAPSGTAVMHSFTALDIRNATSPWGGWTGDPFNVAPNMSVVGLSYDYLGNSVYCHDHRLNQSVLRKQMIEKLDSSDYSNLWFGFESDKVYLQFRADSLRSNTAGFVISKLYGIDDLSSATLPTTETLSLTINTPYGESEMPNAVYGGEYKIPTAIAQSEEGLRKVDIKCDYNFESDNPITVPIDNGRVHTNRIGSYRITYTAYDIYGNETKEYRYFSCFSKVDTLVVSPKQPSYVAKVGTNISIDAPTISGGSGVSDLTATVSDGSKTIDISNTLSFVPETTGLWTANFEATDYAGQKASATVSIVVEDNPDAIIPSINGLPRYIFNGTTYDLPLVYAKKYTGTAVEEIRCDVEVTAGDTTTTYQSGESFKLDFAEECDIGIQYKCGNSKSNLITVKGRPVISGNNVNFAEYFVTDAKAEVLKKAVKISNETSETKDFSMEYANAIHENKMRLTVQNIADASYIKEIHVVLTDSEDSTLTASANLVLSKTTTGFSVGSHSVGVSVPFASSNSAEFEIEYSNGSFVFQGVNLPIAKYDNGVSFQGFPSKRVFFRIDSVGVSAGSGYQISQIGGFLTGNIKRDSLPPSVILDGGIAGNYRRGSEYTTPIAASFDLLSPFSEVKLSVFTLNEAGDEQYVTSKDGVLLNGVDCDREFTFSLAEYGTYTILYEASEGSRWKWQNNERYQRTIGVVDVASPTIEFASEWAETVSVGSKITVPDIIVRDNCSSAENIDVRVVAFDVNEMAVTLTVENGVCKNYIVAKVAGTYKFVVIAKDEAGNTATVIKTVVAK